MQRCTWAASLHEEKKREGITIRLYIELSTIESAYEEYTYIYIYMRVYMYVYIYVYIHICVCVCIYIFTYVYIYKYICIYICICTYTYIHTHKNTYVCMNMYVYIYMYMHICAYFHDLMDRGLWLLFVTWKFHVWRDSFMCHCEMNHLCVTWFFDEKRRACLQRHVRFRSKETARWEKYCELQWWI